MASCQDNPDLVCPCGYSIRGGHPYVENVPPPENPRCGCYPRGFGFPQEMQQIMARCGENWGCGDENSQDCINPCDYPQLHAPGCPWEEPAPCADGTYKVDGVCNDCPDGSAPNEDGTCGDNSCPDGSSPPNHAEGECEDDSCPDGSAPNEDGECGDNSCPDGSEPNEDGECGDNSCPDGSEPNEDGECGDNNCPDGSEPNEDGECGDNRCPDGSEPNEDGECGDSLCPDGSEPNEDGECEGNSCPDGSAPNEDGECEDNRCPDGSSPPNHAEGECEDDRCPDGSVPNEDGVCGEECRNDIFIDSWNTYVHDIECVPDCEARLLNCEYKRCGAPITVFSGLSLDTVPVGSVQGYSSACPVPECPREMEYNEETRSCVCEIGGARTFPYSDNCPINFCENGEPYYRGEECCENGSIANIGRCYDNCSNDILFSALGHPGVARAVNIRVNDVECIPDCREGKRVLRCQYQQCGEEARNIDLSLASIVPGTYRGYDELCPNTPTCPTEGLRWDEWRETCVCPDGEVPEGDECNCQNDVHFPQLGILVKEPPACYKNCASEQAECTYTRCGEAESPTNYFPLSDFPDLERKCCTPESGSEWDNFQESCICPQSGEPPPEDTGICACEEDLLFPPEDILVKSWKCSLDNCDPGTVSCTYEMCNGDIVTPLPYDLFEDDSVSSYRSECD